MKHKLCIFILFVFLSGLLPVSAFATPAVSAQSALVLEADSGRVLYEKNGDTPMPMASTTKIMTALVALESGNLTDLVKISPSAAAVEGSSMYLEPGESMTLEDLLYGLMLASGNDAAVAIAEHLGGVDAFVEQMNQKAKDLGANQTHFTNPNGLPDEAHYSTARDMALISAHCLKNPDFATIVSTITYQIQGQGKAYPRTLTNHNKLLRLYESCIGVKTGFTKAAGRCLVSAARRDGMTLICVTLHAPDDWNDHISLYEHLFSTYQRKCILEKGATLATIPVLDSETTSLPVTVLEDVYYPLSVSEKCTTTLNLSDSLSAPVSQETHCGTISLCLGNQTVAELPLVTTGAAEKKAPIQTLIKTLEKKLSHLYQTWFSFLLP